MEDPFQILPRLKALSTAHQSEFSASLIPGCKPILGVRLPELRKIAKEIAKTNYQEFLLKCPTDYFEEETLKAYVLGYAKDDVSTILMYANEFIKTIKNWSVSDSFCQNFTIARKEPERVFSWLITLIDSKGEFKERVVAVILMSHFLNDTYIDKVFPVLDSLTCDGYYTKMGVAWCVATAYAKYPEKTEEYLKNNRLSEFTFRKAVQKMCESFRVSKEAKEYWKQRK